MSTQQQLLERTVEGLMGIPYEAKFSYRTWRPFDNKEYEGFSCILSLMSAEVYRSKKDGAFSLIVEDLECSKRFTYREAPVKKLYEHLAALRDSKVCDPSNPLPAKPAERLPEETLLEKLVEELKSY